MWLYDRSARLAALDHVPHGARLVSFVGRPCTEPWAMSRLLHLPGLAIVRRHAFSNDQWTMAGAQLLEVRYGPAGRSARPDPDRHPPALPRDLADLDLALADFPRDAFDYVWLIAAALRSPQATKGCVRSGRSGPSALYRVESNANSDTPGRERHHPADEVTLRPKMALNRR